MQKRRVISVIVGSVLCLGAIAAAQDQPFTSKADKVAVAPIPQPWQPPPRDQR